MFGTYGGNGGGGMGSSSKGVGEEFGPPKPTRGQRAGAKSKELGAELTKWLMKNKDRAKDAIAKMPSGVKTGAKIGGGVGLAALLAGAGYKAFSKDDD